MPLETTVQRMSAAELRKLYGGRTREENLEIMADRIKTRFAEIRLISGFVDDEVDLALQSNAGSGREED